MVVRGLARCSEGCDGGLVCVGGALSAPVGWFRVGRVSCTWFGVVGRGPSFGICIIESMMEPISDSGPFAGVPGASPVAG